MKKDILFIIPSLGAGGGEKSLINLLTVMDYEKYNVDLFLLNKDGLFMEFLPKEVRVLEISNDVKIFKDYMSKSVIKFLLKGKFKLAYSRLMFTLKNRMEKNPGKAEQYSWKYLKNAIGIIDKKYDVAIGYLEKTSNYICVDCVQANKKIGWIHTDYNKLNLDKEFDEKFFKKLNFLVTISDECSNVLKDNFKELEDNIKIIPNIVSAKTIKKLAKEDIDLNRSENIIVSIGRLSYEKGFDIAIKACSKLIKNKIPIVWYIIGEGKERENLQALISKNKLQDKFILVGQTTNPYKYLERADIYVQPSRFEGKSIAMDEAKILNKPIIATNFSTVRDQIEDKYTGIISGVNEDDLADKIYMLINDTNLRKNLINNLSNTFIDTEKEISKLYKLIG